MDADSNANANAGVSRIALRELPSGELKRSDKKQPRKGGDIFFSHYKSMGVSVAMETRVLIQSARSLSPIQVMLHIKFDQDWPTGFRDIQV